MAWTENYLHFLKYFIVSVRHIDIIFCSLTHETDGQDPKDEQNS